MKTYVWMIREQTTGLWLCSKDGDLVTQDQGWIWRRADLAERAMKRTINGYTSKAQSKEQGKYPWLCGPTVSTMEQVYEGKNKGQGWLHIDKCKFKVIRLELRIS